MRINGKSLKNALRSAGFTQEEAAIKLGTTRQTLSKWFNYEQLDSDVLQNVKTSLGLDLEADLFTEGARPGKPLIQTTKNTKNIAGLIPFYNADFIAGNAELYYDDETIYPEYYMDVPEFSGSTAFRAYGDSMEPRIKSGNILFGQKIDNWRSHLEYGQIYGITCLSGIRYLKYIRRHAEDPKNYFLFKSANPEYDDMEMPKSDIKNIWLINGWIDKRT